MDYSSSDIRTPLEMIFQPSNLYYPHKTTNLNLASRILKIDVDIFAHSIDIVLENR